MQQDSGNLNITNNFKAGDFAQNGGTLSSGTSSVENFSQTDGQINAASNFSVNNSFSQIGGTIDSPGDVDIDHNTGELAIQSLVGRNINLNNTSGGVALNNVTSNGNLTVEASGEISQTTGGFLSVAGESRMTTPDTVSLTNGSNVFGGTVFVDSSSHTVQSNSPINVTKQGNALAQESGRAQEESTRDTLIRPAAPGADNQGSVMPSTLQWLEAFRQLIIEITPESLIQGVSKQPLPNVSEGGNEIRLKQVVEEER